MVSRLDDYLGHQVAEPFAYVGTSDRNFFDRYAFVCHDIEGKMFLMLAFGQYPNLGVTDAFATVVYEGKQHVVRASRELGTDRLNTTIGPLTVEVLDARVAALKGKDSKRRQRGRSETRLAETDVSLGAEVPERQRP